MSTSLGKIEKDEFKDGFVLDDSELDEVLYEAPKLKHDSDDSES